MPRGKRSGKWFYIAAATVAFFWLIGQMGKTGSSQTSQRSPDISYTSQTSAPEPTATPTPEPEVRRAVAVPIQRAIAVNHNAGAESSDSYVPAMVKLTADVTFPVRSGSIQTGIRGVESGTAVKLYKIVGEKVIVQYEGLAAAIPAYQTDLLDRMTGEITD